MIEGYSIQRSQRIIQCQRDWKIFTRTAFVLWLLLVAGLGLDLYLTPSVAEVFLTVAATMLGVFGVVTYTVGRDLMLLLRR